MSARTLGQSVPGEATLDHTKLTPVLLEIFHGVSITELFPLI